MGVKFWSSVISEPLCETLKWPAVVKLIPLKWASSVYYCVGKNHVSQGKENPGNLAPLLECPWRGGAHLGGIVPVRACKRGQGDASLCVCVCAVTTHTLQCLQSFVEIFVPALAVRDVIDAPVIRNAKTIQRCQGLTFLGTLCRLSQPRRFLLIGPLCS